MRKFMEGTNLVMAKVKGSTKKEGSSQSELISCRGPFYPQGTDFVFQTHRFHGRMSTWRFYVKVKTSCSKLKRISLSLRMHRKELLGKTAKICFIQKHHFSPEHGKTLSQSPTSHQSEFKMTVVGRKKMWLRQPRLSSSMTFGCKILPWQTRNKSQGLVVLTSIKFPPLMPHERQRQR